jgi:hypothetical protein
LSLEREVDQMVNDMMQKEGWTRSYALSILRSKFESEERYQEISYVDALITKIAEEQEEEQEFEPTTTTTDTVAHNVTTTSLRKPSKVTPHQQETVSSKSVSKQLDKQTTKINKNIMQMLQPLQKHIKSADKQSELMKQLQSQLKQLQKQVSQIQRAVSIGMKKKATS